MTEFDVFLCHNGQDKPEVIKIARQLQQQGVKPWLDLWELPPGKSWQDLLEEQLDQIKSAAIFVGSSGFGPWQIIEMRAFIREFVRRKCPVIPVLLEDAPQKPELPILLQDLTWVDFRHGESNPMKRLIWGITQKKPDIFDEVKSTFQSLPENLGNDVQLEMIAIPGGKFLMGSPEGESFDEEKPQHEVIIQPFYMGKYPVTQEQYEQIMGGNPSSLKGSENPVECVSWDDAVQFCRKLSEQTGTEYRLPSEAEWEYACRAGTTTAYCFGETITREQANYGDNVHRTTPVGRYKPNKFGLYDMHGNVWEWCQDDWHDSYKGASNCGMAWVLDGSSKKVIRGGSWACDLYDSRSAYRDNYDRDDRSDVIGFRVVCAFIS